MKLKEICGYPIRRWGYEKAFATDFIIKFERDDEWNEIERHWAKQFGRSIDNKVTYEIKSDDSSFYVTFHDSDVYIGTSVRSYHGGDFHAVDYDNLTSA